MTVRSHCIWIWVCFIRCRFDVYFTIFFSFQWVHPTAKSTHLLLHLLSGSEEPKTKVAGTSGMKTKPWDWGVCLSSRARKVVHAAQTVNRIQEQRQVAIYTSTKFKLTCVHGYNGCWVVLPQCRIFRCPNVGRDWLRCCTFTDWPCFDHTVAHLSSEMFHRPLIMSECALWLLRRSLRTYDNWVILSDRFGVHPNKMHM